MKRMQMKINRKIVDVNVPNSLVKKTFNARAKAFSWFEPDCCYKDDCAGKDNNQCGGCRYNKKNAPNHYQPVPMHPWFPPNEIPWIPFPVMSYSNE